jgi:hypothetical protein
MMQGLSTAKWGYVTRRLIDHDETQVSGVIRAPRLGDFVLARVVRLGAHDHVENVHGRRVLLYPGDLVVGAYGNRYATDFYEGYLPTANGPVHLLTAGGLIGSVASAHTSRPGPTELEVLSALVDRAGAPMGVEDVAVGLTRPARPALGTVVVVGSSMNAGKTTVAAAIVRGLSRVGLRVGAGKVTGSGSGKDHWAYLDAGAARVSDFLDFGMASTFGYPQDRLIETMTAIRDHLVAGGSDAVVLEIADGMLQPETRALAAHLPGFADQVVLAVGDALGAVAGIKVLAELGVRVRAISGLVTASPLASREAAAATGLPVLTPAELASGVALDLLPGASERVHEGERQRFELGGSAA